jgi:hypothetical protein
MTFEKITSIYMTTGEPTTATQVALMSNPSNHEQIIWEIRQGLHLANTYGMCLARGDTDGCKKYAKYEKEQFKIILKLLGIKHEPN